jgi:hypothetical protein
MAQKIHVELVDDIDQSPASETVSFGLDGVQYQIDLSEANATALREALAPYLGHARRAAGGGRRRAGTTTAGAGSDKSGPSAAEIREWARANGWDVPDRGRVSSEVREAYAAAH